MEVAGIDDELDDLTATKLGVRAHPCCDHLIGDIGVEQGFAAEWLEQIDVSAEARVWWRLGDFLAVKEVLRSDADHHLTVDILVDQTRLARGHLNPKTITFD